MIDDTRKRGAVGASAGGRGKRRSRRILGFGVVVVLLVGADLVLRNHFATPERPELTYREAAIEARRTVAEGPWISVDGRVLVDAQPAAPAKGTFITRAVSTPSEAAPAVEGVLEPYEDLEVEVAAPWPGPEYSLAEPPRPGLALLRKGKISGAAVQQRMLREPAPARLRTTREVALTFDDGPGPYSDSILDTLEAKQVPATFFVVGRSALLNPRHIKRMAASGHHVENHSWAHQHYADLRREQVLADIARTDNQIRRLTARRPVMFRPPYGDRSQAILDAVRESDHRYVMWEISPREHESPTADMIVSRVLAELRPGAIILLHETYGPTAEALPRLIDGIRAAGYTMSLLTPAN